MAISAARGEVWGIPSAADWKQDNCVTDGAERLLGLETCDLTATPQRTAESSQTLSFLWFLSVSVFFTH